jgi:hypothetical protein
MYSKSYKPKENLIHAVANSVAQKKNNGQQGFGFVDNRPEAVVQHKIQESVNHNLNVKQLEVIQRASGDVNGEFVEIPSGELKAERKYMGKLGAMFNMTAKFKPVDDSSDDADCSKGVFIQYVRGKFILNGSPVSHTLPYSKKLDESNWTLDGPAGSDYYYGKRGWLNGASQYDPHPNGGDFSGSDFPGLLVTEDDYGIVDLEFKAQLLDTGRKLILKEQTWTVYGLYSGTELEKGYEADIEDNDL